ncbi:endonuclease NucS [Infirmifilum lucidum]|uniref:Endonuclease NucS n=1 Tax=Infirmifilum lucidum TaxID=2776706 RepID=A0A7L9FII5_9CREN|nr:endonuclease NucS [Infirmifilum lucidum]QOJ79441.1 endonuclease NucS [Infirmifilum lucidum]
MEDIAEALRESIKRRETVILVGECEIEYKGRASSKLGRGERIVIIKRDGSLLVHRPTGVNPVNYQPESSLVNVYSEEDRLVIRSLRPRPGEELTIKVYRILGLHTYRIEDNAQFEMWGDEEDIKKAIMVNPKELLGEDLNPLEEEMRISTAGYADLILVDSSGNYVVVEVKRETASVDAVYQLKRYVDRLRREINPRVRGILVAQGITRSAAVALEKEGLEFRRINMRKVYEVLKGGLTGFL